MNLIKSTITILIAGIVLAGCKTAADYYGEGPINLSSNVTNGFEKYKNGPGPEYFAVSEDGRTYGWVFCRAGPGYCRGGGLPETIALNSCQRNSKVPCKIYAKGKKVVWKGPVGTGNPSANSSRFPASKSQEVVCAYAVDYSSDTIKWSENEDLLQYVEEAKRRGFSLEKCDEMN